MPTMVIVDKSALVEAARRAREHAYAPYSNYKVGAALLTSNGALFTGCNVENAVYPATICAERVAMAKAMSEGERDFVALAVATHNGGMPCGICRQVMHELGPEMLVIVADGEGIIGEYRVSELLPGGFGSEHLA